MKKCYRNYFVQVYNVHFVQVNNVHFVQVYNVRRLRRLDVQQTNHQILPIILRYDLFNYKLLHSKGKIHIFYLSFLIIMIIDNKTKSKV